MPPSERILRNIGKVTILRDEIDNPIHIEEFDGIEDTKEWNSINSLTLTNTKSLTSLPPLPKQIKELTLTDTAIKTLSKMPKSLIHLSLIRNHSLRIPEVLPKSLRKITLRGNNFKILPQMPMIDSNKIIIEEEQLREPFLTLYNNYKDAKRDIFEQPMRAFFRQLNAIWELIHEKEIPSMMRAKMEMTQPRSKVVYTPGTTGLSIKEELMQRTWHPNKLQRLLNEGYSLNSVSNEFAPIVEGVGTKEGGAYKHTRKNRNARLKKGKSRRSRS